MIPEFTKRKVKAMADTPATPTNQPLTKSNKRKKRFSCFFIILIIFFGISGLILGSDNKHFLGGVKNSYFIRQITNIISSKNKYLAGEKEDRINIVLLGIGGEGHDGPYLTDTIILASLRPSDKKAALFSIPRDMIVPYNYQGLQYYKINEIYTLGQENGVGGGELFKQVLGETLDLPIHYYAVIDFKGFAEIIDRIGGVKVDVETSFADNQFPTADYKVQTISFEKGEQKMDGLTALRFARSRHGNNGEGSDFARIKRQQKIILAAKDKLTSFNTLINPKKISDIFSIVNQYTRTDIELWEVFKLAQWGKDINTEQIVTQSIDDRPGNYLQSGISTYGAYILQPIGGNYLQIQDLVKNIFTLSTSHSEQARIVIQNGTPVPGLALQAASHLEQLGYQVVKYGNAANQDKIATVIYNYNEDRPQTKKALENIFAVQATDQVPAEYSQSLIMNNWQIVEAFDFVVVLGKDQVFSTSTQLVPTIDPSLLNTSTASSTSSSSESLE